MSYLLRILEKENFEKTKKNLTRGEILALAPEKKYEDGRTKQCHKDECDINKIMARFAVTQTISHLSKYEGVYADYSDFDFREQTTKLAEGNEIFANLSAEIRREFNQDPDAFFAYVNDPENRKMKDLNLPALAKPGDQLPAELASADLEAAQAAGNKQAGEASAALKKVLKDAIEALPAHSEPLAQKKGE